jgi:hypothetical protein
VHNIVVGFGNLGESIVHQMIKIGHFADERAIMITVIEKDPVRVSQFKHFVSRFQNLDQVAEIRLIEEDPVLLSTEDLTWAAQEERESSHLYCIYIAVGLNKVGASGVLYARFVCALSRMLSPR